MRTSAIVLSLFTLLTLTSTAIYGQQTFTQTVTAQNKGCNATCSVIDIPALNSNRNAVIFITPSAANYPHPIGAYYMYLNRWSVFNLDGTAMVAGTTFNVEYYATPDSSHFVYVAPPLAHPNDVRYLDRAGLNNNPNAEVRVTPTNSPPSGVNGATFNSTEVRVAYDTTSSKWFIYNLGNTTVPAGTAYSVKFSDSSLMPIGMQTGTLVPVPTPTPGTPGIPGTPFMPPLTATPPASALPSGPAGGDLSGTYPDPKVVGLQGKPLSTTAPTVGQTLRWNGTQWKPSTDTVSTAAQPKSYFSVLTPDYTWAGGSGYEMALPGMSIQITITTPSVVNVSVYADTIVTTDCGLINNCDGQATGINLYRNNTLLVKTLNRGSNASVTQVLPNYPEIVNPGTYTYKVLGRRIYSNSTIKYLGASNPDESFKSYLSIQVFPQLP